MEPLFELPGVTPLAKPRKPRSGKGVWLAYTAKNPRKCEDCLQVSLEELHEGRLAPLARTARHRLSRGDETVVYVCAEHKQLRDES